MAKAPKLSQESIQDYLDDRMSAREKVHFTEHLQANPADARLVMEIQRQNELVKTIGEEILDEPVPDRLKAVISNAQDRNRDGGSTRAGTRARWGSGGGIPARWLVAASLAALIIGGNAGWYMRDYLDPPVTSADIILSSGLDAYRLYGADENFPVEFTSDKIDTVMEWLDRSFKAPIKIPVLDNAGYKLLGGRVLPYASGNYGFFLFENDKRERIAVICWPRAQTIEPVRRFSPGKDYTSRYWNKDKFGFAVYANSANSQFDAIADTIVEFYDGLFKQD